MHSCTKAPLRPHHSIRHQLPPPSIAMADGSSSTPLHIAVFPWLAFGHIIPHLHLSKLLARRGHRVSFLSTPRNIDRLPPVPPSLSHLLTYVKLPSLPDVPGLPPNAEATMDVPLSKVQHLKKAFDDGLRGPFAAFLRDRNPDWVVHDYAHYWAPPLASDLGIPTAFFVILSASSLAFLGPPSMGPSFRQIPEDLTISPPWVPFPSPVSFRLHEARRIHAADSGAIPNAAGVSDADRLSAVLGGCDAIIVKTAGEFEAEYVDLLVGGLFGKPVLPVDFPPPTEEEMGGGKDANDLIQWLDGQGAGSVLYVALGSEASLSVDLVHELALGLELSGAPFLWALRKSLVDDADQMLLPEGLEERTRGRGLVTTGWAQQVRILAHPAVGGFLTHCGWSSCVEAMHAAVPLVLLPIALDQGLVARMMAAGGVGVEVARDDEGDGSFTREGVAEAVRVVMVEEKELFRAKARETREVFCDEGAHRRYADGLVRYLEERRRRPVV